MRERANRRTTATCRLRFAPTQIAEYRNFGMWQNVVRNAWEARFILLRYMCEEKEEKTCPSWMLAVHGSQKTKEM